MEIEKTRWSSPQNVTKTVHTTLAGGGWGEKIWGWKGDQRGGDLQGRIQDSP